MGPEHSTIYVEQHLPGDWQPGMTLDGAQLQHIRNLLASRDAHLRRLYGYIKQIYSEFNQLKEQRGLQAPPAVAPEGDDAAGRAEACDERRALLAEAEAHRLQARVTELEQSTSWRVTAPMRAVSRWLRRL